MSDLIAALDGGLALTGEDITIRRVVGKAPNQVNIDVKCRARVLALNDKQLAAGIPSNELNVIISPTQINNAQWPGGQVPALPPFDLDQRIPRAGTTDKVLMCGQPPRSVTFGGESIIGGEWVRSDMRVMG